VDYSDGIFRIGGTLKVEPRFAGSLGRAPVFSLKADYAR
jgi:hypothetical protein